MDSSGDLFIDARRTDIIEYAFRIKDLRSDLIKVRANADAAIARLDQLGIIDPVKDRAAEMAVHLGQSHQSPAGKKYPPDPMPAASDPLNDAPEVSCGYTPFTTTGDTIGFIGSAPSGGATDGARANMVCPYDCDENGIDHSGRYCGCEKGRNLAES